MAPKRRPNKRGKFAEHDRGRSYGKPDKGDSFGPPAALFEVEVLPGLVPFVAEELKRFGAQLLVAGEGGVTFYYTGPRARLFELRRCVSVYEVLRFDVPRPKALLGHEHFTRILALVGRLRQGPPEQEFAGIRLGAAGGGSPVFARLTSALAEASGLAHRSDDNRSDDGELLLRFRRDPKGGWEVLGRLTPRPLSARAWRECNMPGGLNASIAAVSHDLLGSSAGDRYLNLMCGSGTLLIERGLAGKWARGVGIDIERQAIACASRNVAAAGLMAKAELLVADALSLPFERSSFNRLSVDLPWGDAVGDHQGNAQLYPRFLDEAGRVAAPSANLLVITHELKLFERVLAAQSLWRLGREPLRVFQGGHRPGLHLLERSRKP
ncbi:MAG: methyltransferase domain-containing protein [Trueperaceae bacterium]